LVALGVLLLALAAGLFLLFFSSGPVMRAPAPDRPLRWTGPIDLCFRDPAVEERLRVQVFEAARTWMEHSGAVFRLQQDCRPVRGADGRMVRPVEIVFLLDPGAFAAADHLGNRLAGGGRIHLQTEYRFNDPLCGDRGSVGRLGCVYAEAVHELGHVLGFGHDHVSANAPECHGRSISLETVDRELTYYDPSSVMNYCNTRRWLGKLSEADICSVQVAYPEPGAQPRDPRECEAIAARRGVPAESSGKAGR
jgi:hypothetical protein